MSYEFSLADFTSHAKQNIESAVLVGKKIKKSFGYIKNNIIFVVQLNNNNMAKMKYQILSPDGFSLERDVIGYTSKEKAMDAFNRWKRGYEPQGFYSSTKYGRIPLEDLEDYCQFIER